LVEAAVRRFAAEFDSGASDAEIQWESSIPRNVGLAGSSALVVATLRALGDLARVELDPARLAALALAVETDDLGIAAGPQDRVVQAYGGLVFMDFRDGAYEELDTGLLPPMLIAWRPEAGGHSGGVHESLARRHAAGEELVHETIEGLARAARAARAALVARDPDAFGQCVDRTFDLRAAMLELDPRCVEMVEIARACGASANYTGSGGAIVLVSGELERLDAAEGALHRLGCETGRL
jgi:glucuronokinase